MGQHQALPVAVYNLLTMPSNRAQRRFAYIIGALVTLISLFTVPFVRIQLGEMPAFQPAIFSTVVCFELITAYVIYSQFKISRQPAVLALFAGYLFSAGMSLVYILAFPRVFADNGLFNSGPQTSVWVYSLWHIGFPVAVLLYLRLEAKHRNVRYSSRKAKLAGWCTFFGTIILMTVFTLFTTHFVERLPTVLSQGQLSPAFVKFVGIPIVVLTFITLLIFYVRTKASTVTSTWLCVAILAMMLDVVIVLCGGGRFSLGWYVAKWNSFVCSNVVLAGMIYEFTKMYLNMADLFRKVKDSEYSYKVLLGESQQAERTISEQNTIIEQMLESSHEAIIMCDTVGRVIFANRRVELFFENPIHKGDCLFTYCEGMRASDTAFKSIVEAYFNQTIPPFLKRISRVSHSGEMKHYECYVNPIVDEGADTLRGHLFGFRDRTEEERIDEMKNEFVSIISHEIRTPLSSIMGFIEILATRNVTEDKRVKYVETIHKESMRLSNLINDFLDLQRLDSGRQVFHFQTLNTAHLVGEIVDQWQGKDNHEIELHVLDESLFIHGDEERLKQVFHNLISNSIKYSPDQSKIDVYVERENGRVHIKIQDYGLGIPAEALDKLFGRFYRVDNSDRRKIGGTGLGLSIVKEIVEAHHGKVLVESELGRGSIFTVQFDEHKEG
ncbi:MULTISPECIES: MASE4 domain-containing protein [Paenibacillus]|uniref:histidine kinase n=1 Tax=Paenibacillus violae TaxID=3077234 RepID=A0ABU3RE55_9BACL|nr:MULTISPECIES: MASE4 domain-containing protein [Paenibacillus]MDU0202368.1 MASE4 domain-containing protein [Paenibacillus sp. PFR10]MEC0266207.1 MASE4 domain-containing protein [Paenibacillus anseongense]